MKSVGNWLKKKLYPWAVGLYRFGYRFCIGSCIFRYAIIPNSMASTIPPQNQNLPNPDLGASRRATSRSAFKAAK